jgi:hypothetical protein
MYTQLYNSINLRRIRLWREGVPFIYILNKMFIPNINVIFHKRNHYTYFLWWGETPNTSPRRYATGIYYINYNIIVTRVFFLLFSIYNFLGGLPTQHKTWFTTTLSVVPNLFLLSYSNY